MPQLSDQQERDWAAVRLIYEQGDESQRKLASRLGISASTLMKRATREQWQQNSGLVAAVHEATAKTYVATIEREAELQIPLAAKAAVSDLLADLTPWIESEKRKQVIRAVKRAVEHQERIDSVALTVEDPKGMAMIATAEDKFDAIIRRNLGMSEGTGIGGSLNINILANQASITTAEPNE